MKRLHSYLLRTVLLCFVPISTYAQSIELQAITDFTNLDSGEVPYYIETAGERNALAINAAIPAQRNKFARAEHVFTGSDGLYDITINALGEIDGDGTYRLLVNGVVQGVSVNTPVTVDYTVIEHLFQAIAITNQDTLAVESKAVSNDMIPEGDGFAFARGRWRSLTLGEHTSNATTVDTSVDLELSITSVESVVTTGAPVSINVSITNNATTNTATAPIVNFSLPNELRFISSDVCVATQDGVQCALPNLAPEQMTNVSFSADTNGSGSIELSASVSADQIDNNIANNAAVLTFETVSQMSTTVDMQTEPSVTDTVGSIEPIDEIDGTDNIEVTSTNTGINTDADINTSTEIDTMAGISTNTATNNTSDMNDSVGTAGLPGLFVLMLLGAYRVNRRP